MDQSRRGFLKKLGFVATGAGAGLPLLEAAGRALEEGLAEAAPGGKQWGMVIDVRKCLGAEGAHVRRACAEACDREHNVPHIVDEQGQPIPRQEIKWIWSAEYEDAFPDQAHQYTEASLSGKPVLVLCNHCTSPPCVKVCPTQATWKRESDGIVMMDMHRCIGCRYCIAACPYGSRSFNWRDPRRQNEKGEFRHFGNSRSLPSTYPTRTKGVVEKCNFCAERLAEGGEPACVVAARQVTGAQRVEDEPLTWGDLKDPKSAVSRKLRANYTICRRLSLGTGPNVFYIV